MAMPRVKPDAVRAGKPSERDQSVIETPPMKSAAPSSCETRAGRWMSERIIDSSRFMEGPLSFFRMHWDHNRCRAGARTAVSARTWLSALRFMESLLSPLHMPWDPEPTPNPSQEGNWHDADECLLPPWEGSGVGRPTERLGVGAEADLSRTRVADN